MKIWRNRPEAMLGYARVSTRRQEEQGMGLETQCKKIRNFCLENDVQLDAIFEDAASASGKDSHLKRGDLLAVVQEAQRLCLPLVVASLDRLARHRSAMKLLDVPGLDIYSVKDGGRVSKKQLRRAIAEARKAAASISREAKESWNHLRSTDGRIYKAGLDQVSRRRGSVANVLRSESKVIEVADFLERHPEFEDLGARRLFSILNEAGVLNLVSERHGLRELWTKDSLHKTLIKARGLLQFRRENANEPFHVIEVDATRPAKAERHAEAHALCRQMKPSSRSPVSASHISV